MNQWVEYLFDSVDSISDDNNLGDIVKTRRLVDTTPDGKQFRFSTFDVNRMMDCLSKEFVKSVNMCNGGSNVILNTHIRCYNGD